MSAKLTTQGTDHIIGLIQQISKAATKTDFLPPKEKKLLDDYRSFEDYTNDIATAKKLDKSNKAVAKLLKSAKAQLKQIKTPYDQNESKRLKRKLSDEKIKHLNCAVQPLQKKLDLLLAPLWTELNKSSFQPRNLQKWIWGTFLSGNIMSLENNIIYDNQAMIIAEFTKIGHDARQAIRELERIRAKIEYENKKSADTEQQSGKAGDKNKPKKKLKPLSANAAAVYELLKDLPEHRAMKGGEILKALENQKPHKFIDQSTLTKNIIPELRPYGVTNKRGAGYYIRK